MPRQCSICTHPNRQEIDREIVAGTAIRGIAQRFAVSSDSLQRHKMTHLTDLLASAVEAERERGVELVTRQREQDAEREAVALDVMTELRWIFDHAKKMLAACDDWLTDPGDLTRYDLRPRAGEIMVHYEDLDVTPNGDTVVRRRKGKLSDLLETVRERGTDRTFTLVETKSADPRRLILQTVAELRPMIELLAKLVGELDERPVNVVMLPEWVTLRSALLDALAGYPEARTAVGERLMALGAGGTNE